MAQGAFVIIQNDGRDILLVKRKDVPLWDLPGGGIEEGETPEAAAVREAFEETGYNVTILQKSGEYERPAFEDTQHVFIGAITGGTPLMNGSETAPIYAGFPKTGCRCSWCRTENGK
ncbi:8-oxo-dGTP diphosphatase [Bacillus velezensis]|nr:8-oxo-dGTP diphosphatase [Bacillus velezensis]